MAITVKVDERDDYPGPRVDVFVYDDARPRWDGKANTSLFARSNKDSLFIIDIQSSGDDRGRGYGTRALQALLEWARAHGIGVIEGKLGGADWERRDKLVAFYEHRGAKVILDHQKETGRILWTTAIAT
jgi:GNAT superfamily N-acetyltransferase